MAAGAAHEIVWMFARQPLAALPSMKTSQVPERVALEPRTTRWRVPVPGFNSVTTVLAIWNELPAIESSTHQDVGFEDPESCTPYESAANPPGPQATSSTPTPLMVASC